MICPKCKKTIPDNTLKCSYCETRTGLVCKNCNTIKMIKEGRQKLNKLWSSKVKEEIYIEKLENGLTVFIIPKKNTSKKYVILGTEFGSIDNHFILDGNEITVPDGIAHYLEHKLFEQKNNLNTEILNLTLKLSELEQKVKEKQLENINLMSITLLVFHLDISGIDNNNEQLKNINPKFY